MPELTSGNVIIAVIAYFAVTNIVAAWRGNQQADRKQQADNEHGREIVALVGRQRETIDTLTETVVSQAEVIRVMLERPSEN